MVDAAWIVRMDDLDRWTLAFLYMGAVQFCHAIPFWNGWSFHSSIAIHAHRPQVYHMAGLIVLHYGNQNIFCRLCIVRVCVVDSFDAFHRVGGCSLFGQVHKNMWIEYLKSSLKLLLLARNIELGKSYKLACELLPLFEPLLYRSNWCYAAISVF